LGRVIKAGELTTGPEVLGRRGREEVARALEVRCEVEELARVARGRVVDLALSMARAIVGEAVALDPALLDRIYERSLAEIGELMPVLIRVHPDDRAASRIDDFARRRGVEVVDDPAVGRAGCRVEACGAAIDATVEAAVAALSRSLKGTSRV
jgi:flagellar assembly protein FliH